MKTHPAVLSLAAACALGSAAHALYSVSAAGTWPKSWPRPLEPLRKQARTYVGPMVEQQHHAIRFTRRQDFEAAWPHLLKVKTRGAPVLLVRESFFMGKEGGAGVIVHAPPVGQHRNPATPEAPIPGVTNPRERWMNTTYLEVVVDGDIIDAGRLRIPENTPTLDERDKPKGR